MRISPRLLAVALCMASAGAAFAQVATPRTPAQSGLSGLPDNVNFAYDAARGQITANGIHLTPSAKSPTVAPITGTIVVTLNVKVVSHFGSDTTYHCSVYAIGGAIDVRTATVDGGMDNVNAFAVPTTAGNASCTMTIPYEWIVAQGRGVQNGLILAFGVGAVNSHDEVGHSTFQVDGIENLPADGTTQKYTFDVML